MKTILQFNSIHSFSTKRLVAEKMQANNVDLLRTMYTNEKVMQTLGGIRNEIQINENINWNLQQWDNNGFGFWMFYLKDTGEWVGRGGLRRIEVDGNSEVEVGYALMPKFWNKGIATEIAKACLEMAFEVIRLENVVSFTLTTNKASQRVMEKCGFKYERDILHDDLPHVLFRFKNQRKVELVPYNKKWPDYFKKESQHIKSALGNHLKEIHHFGSTAIPAMSAKPVIDILLECDNLDDIDFITTQLNKLNYYNIRRHIIPHRSFFTRRQDSNISYNLHIRERGDPQIKRQIHFRDYLIHHPQDATAYANLKLQLAAEFKDDINKYVFGKDNLIKEIDKKAKVWQGRKRDFHPFNTGPRANSWTQEKIIKAMESNLNVHMTHFAQYITQINLIRVPGYTAVNSGLLDDTFNYVLESDFSKNDANVNIETITNYFANDKIPFSWWVSPYDKPDDLGERLQQAGLINAENNVGMYINLDTWEPPGDKNQIEIIKVTDKKGLDDFKNVFVTNQSAYDKYYKWVSEIYTLDDPIEFYVGYMNGKPVTRGQLVYFAQVASIQGVSTATDERRKGYGTAIEQFLLQHAKEQGFHIAVLQASEEGLPLYLKQGFKECCTFKEFKPNDR